MTATSKAFSLIEVRPGQTGQTGLARPSRARLASVTGRTRDSAAAPEADAAPAPGPAPGPASGPAPGLSRGKVLSQGAEGLRIALDGGAATWARRAAGCLLRPETGDTVLVHLPGAGAEAGDAYVLSVLEKAAGASVLDAPGELRIEAAVSLALAAPEVRLRGKAGRFDFLGLDLLVGTMTAKAGRIAAVAAAIDSRVGDLTQNIRLSVCQVETQVVRAGGIRQFIRDRFLVRAGRAAILAEDEVTVDAKKIHLG